jgi:monoterpene epsilon-lactone hydrolase
MRVGSGQPAVWKEFTRLVLLTAAAASSLICAPGQAAENSALPRIGPDGTSHLPALDVPLSSFTSPEARRAFIKIFNERPSAPAADADIGARRGYYDRLNRALVSRAKELYAVDIEKKAMGGVQTEIITPKEGIATKNGGRVLINLHGGAFLWGGEGSGGEIESIPIAALGKITVIAVAYRQAPEFKFPAASEDVASVYRELLKDHKARDIGIYGCSAGGILAAESVAWLQKEKLPIPGAIGTFCGTANRFGGDSSYLAPALTAESPLPGATTGQMSFTPYFSEADLSDPLVFPANSAKVLENFPPTLLIAGSRDFAASALFHAQEALTNAGVEAELHIWDGMWHAFFMDPDLPESKEVYRVIVKFFDRHLGRRASRPSN